MSENREKMADWNYRRQALESERLALLSRNGNYTIRYTDRFRLVDISRIAQSIVDRIRNPIKK